MEKIIQITLNENERLILDMLIHVATILPAKLFGSIEPDEFDADGIKWLNDHVEEVETFIKKINKDRL